MQNEKQEVKIERYKIGFLVSLLHSLNLEQIVVRELLETYYTALEIGKTNGFMDREIIISDKPNLIEFLLNQEIVEFKLQEENKINRKTLKF